VKSKKAASRVARVLTAIAALPFAVAAAVAASADAAAPASPPAWLVPVVRVVSDTHVVPTTGLVLGPGRVLVPSAFTADGAPLVVLDGGPDLARDGRSAEVLQRLPLAGLALLDVPGLERPAPVLADRPLPDGGELALAAFSPADRIRAGEPFVFRRGSVTVDDAGIVEITAARPLPNLTGALVDACGYWVGYSAARGVASLSTNANTIYTWAPALARDLERAGVVLERSACDAAFEDPPSPVPEPVPESDAAVDEAPEPESAGTGPAPDQPGTADDLDAEADVNDESALDAEVPVEEAAADGAASVAGEAAASTEPFAEPAGTPGRWWPWLLWPLAVVAGWLLGRRSRAVTAAAEHGTGAAPAPWRLVDPGTGEETAIGAVRGTVDCVLGRHDADVLVEGLSVSRRHAGLRGSQRELSVLDLGSTNGTWVNDRRCEPGVATPLTAGDTLRLGDREFTLVADEEATA
jgi:hypothetical protein